jgi:hypothetical protein
MERTIDTVIQTVVQEFEGRGEGWTLYQGSF